SILLAAGGRIANPSGIRSVNEQEKSSSHCTSTPRAHCKGSPGPFSASVLPWISTQIGPQRSSATFDDLQLVYQLHHYRNRRYARTALGARVIDSAVFPE